MIQLADFRCTIKMALIKNSFRIYESFLSFWKNIIFGASTSYLGGELRGLLVYQPMHYDLSSLEVGKFKLHASFSLGLLVSDENICGALSQIIIFRLIVRKKWVLTLKNFKNVYFHGKIIVQ